MITYLFPGQGSQIKGMGEQLFVRFPKETDVASDILGYSIVKLCLEDTNNELHQTQFTQPALFVVNALSYKLRLAEMGQLPDFLAGHSLGEYNALHSAGAFSFEDGLRLVVMRGKLMSCAPKGAMAAVIGPTAEDIAAVLNAELSNVYIANYNSPTQTIVSGTEADIEKLRQLANKAFNDVMVIRLNTSGAFHSPYMAAASEAFVRYLENFSFSPLTIPVVSNVSARPYQQAEIANQLATQITSPVRWTESINYLLNQGEMQFEELGVGNVLTKLMPSIRKHYEAQPQNIVRKHQPESHASSDSRINSSLINSITPGASQSSYPVAPQSPMNKEDWAAAARKTVDQWNQLYPVGTKVRVPGYDRELTTCSPAIVLFRHRAAIYLEGYKGYFALNEISPL
jgi:malonyl CoA-acyl carrier protein transacylase